MSVLIRSGALALVAGAAVAVVAGSGSLAARASTPAQIPVTSYRSASCGCCKGWVQHMRANGFAVRDVVVADLPAIKQRLGVPTRLSSCHTAEVEGFALEGHVPAADVKRLLHSRPAVAGIAVPGMPLGSPGMESAYGKEPFTVLAFTRTGAISSFSRHPQ
ncbi:MAG: CopG family transcriptional regulator [Cyanobium sp. CACIAM 14]|nr:MAG: CopG family transcriptional regulator [Cyanobium sp. CACIAM 14]